MTDPVRWSTPGSGAPPGVRALLRASPPTRSMTASERARAAARIARLAAAPVVAGALTLSSLASAAGAGLVTAAVFVGGYALQTRAAGPPEAAAPATRVAPVIRSRAAGLSPTLPAPADLPPPATIVHPGASAALPEPAAPRPPPSAPIAPGAPPDADPAGDALAREVAWLDAARALLADRPAEALARIEQHAAAFPRGKLGIEREILAIEALRRLGRTDAARARADTLLQRSRGGIYEERVRQLLHALPGSHEALGRKEQQR